LIFAVVYIMTNPQNKTIDRIDRNILVELQINARLSNVELSKRVGLSPTPCLERVKRLEKENYIKGYQAILNPEKLEAALLVLVEITLTKTSPDVFDDFSAAVHELDVIQECHLVSGDFDFLLKTRVADMAAYRELLGDTLLRLPSVSESRTYVVMEEVKSTNYIPIKR
jgi:Lrp/AsnC family leucine-responsive transcriptional regulator